MKVCVLGTGYVGLVVGVCLANRDHQVCCVDVDSKKIAGLQKGILPIYEPGLDNLVQTGVNNNLLHFSTKGEEEIANAEVIYIAVGTPPASDGSADLKYVRAAAKQIAENASKNSIVIIKSTVPVGTADMVRGILADNHAKVVDVVSNPEFLREGVAIEDFENPDRIVVGMKTEFAKEQIQKLYASFLEANNNIYFMDNRSAEITKYASNALLATKISFANELARLCDAAGADIDAVRLGTGSDSRIGHKFLYAGAGYGGSCFPKDVNALIETAEEYGVHLRIARAVEEVNAEQKLILAKKLIHDIGEDLTGKTIAIWGLAFKPETDDIREAPAIYTIRYLLEHGATIQAYDPEAMENIRTIFGDQIALVATKEAALERADALMLLTEWRQFREPDWDLVKKIMKGHHIFDGRNIYQPQTLKELGFTYQGIGRGIV